MAHQERVAHLADPVVFVDRLGDHYAGLVTRTVTTRRDNLPALPDGFTVDVVFFGATASLAPGMPDPASVLRSARDVPFAEGFDDGHGWTFPRGTWHFPA